MTQRRTDGGDVDQDAVLAASAFKVGDLVEVTHPIYMGRGRIIDHGWLENIKRRAGDPSHYLVWWVDPQIDRGWPGVVDIIDPQYGLEERGRSMRAVEEPKR